MQYINAHPSEKMNGEGSIAGNDVDESHACRMYCRGDDPDDDWMYLCRMCGMILKLLKVRKRLRN